MIATPLAEVNWADPAVQVSKYFTVHEACWLPRWSRLATRLDGLDEPLQANLFGFLTGKMDAVREWFGLPINVHCCYRPTTYNALVKGAPGSAHVEGLAMDFDVETLACKDAVNAILAHDMLTAWGLRMENNGADPAWVHLDSRAPGPSGRYFVP